MQWVEVFSSSVCTCRPYLTFSIEEAVKEAQNGGSGVVIYFRKEVRDLGWFDLAKDEPVREQLYLIKVRMTTAAVLILSKVHHSGCHLLTLILDLIMFLLFVPCSYRMIDP